jgi:hypothetical protein
MSKKIIQKSIFFLVSSLLLVILVGTLSVTINNPFIEKVGFFNYLLDFICTFYIFIGVIIFFGSIVTGFMFVLKKIYEKIFN